jgi:hypothetical protein
MDTTKAWKILLACVMCLGAVAIVALLIRVLT